MVSRTSDLDTVKNIFSALNKKPKLSISGFAGTGLRRETVSSWLPVIRFIQEQVQLLFHKSTPLTYITLEGADQQAAEPDLSVKGKRRTREKLYRFIFSYLAARGSLFTKSFEKEGLNASSVKKMVCIILHIQKQPLVVEKEGKYWLDQSKRGYSVLTGRTRSKAPRPTGRLNRARVVAKLLKKQCKKGEGYMIPADARSRGMAPATAVKLLDTLMYLQQQGWHPLPPDKLPIFASQLVADINGLLELASKLPAIKKQRISSMTFYTLESRDQDK